MRLEPGDRAPAFALTSHAGDRVSSSDLAHQKLVIYFYPRAFTPGCTTESCDFRDRHEPFTSAGYMILGVSPDRPDQLAAFREEYDLPFTLLSDPDHEMAEAFGAWGIKKNYGKEYEGLIRSTIVIGENGNVEAAWYNVRAKGHAERVAASLDATG